MHEYINSLLTPHCPGNLELTIPRAKAEDSPRQRGRQFGPRKGRRNPLFRSRKDRLL